MGLLSNVAMDEIIIFDLLRIALTLFLISYGAISPFKFPKSQILRNFLFGNFFLVLLQEFSGFESHWFFVMLALQIKAILILHIYLPALEPFVIDQIANIALLFFIV